MNLDDVAQQLTDLNQYVAILAYRLEELRAQAGVGADREELQDVCSELVSAVSDLEWHQAEQWRLLRCLGVPMPADACRQAAGDAVH